MRMAPNKRKGAKQSPELARYHAHKVDARKLAESISDDDTRISYARSFCSKIIESYWLQLCKTNNTKIKLKHSPEASEKIPSGAALLANEIGALIADFPVEDAGYLIGSVYTVMLPSIFRASLGAYYTPPPLVSRLLDMAEAAGFDFSKGTAIDPACGGGAFLAPIATRMARSMDKASPREVLDSISSRLRGIELDPFAAWMSKAILEASIMPLCVNAKKRLPSLITVNDALRETGFGEFDLVIGNPPYGKVKLSKDMRETYSRSLYGHANLYGLFTDLSLRLSKPGSVIAYLTPTSFLGGQYFKSLREVLSSECSVSAIDFVSDRHGVFDGVLQETLLTTYKKKKSSAKTKISLLVPKGLNSATSEPIGSIKSPKTDDPWVLPRTAKDVGFVSNLSLMPTRLRDIGYSVSTGQLVWNRHKEQLRKKPAKDTLPLVWAESVTSDGFNPQPKRRGHAPFIAVDKKQAHLITETSCVLLQRTTAKEQRRRIIAALIPQDYLDQSGGAVIENHLNIVHKNADLPSEIKPETICTLLNSPTVDRAFRAISGSVAVSAYELNAMPLPTKEQITELQKLINDGSSQDKLDYKISCFYGE